MASIQTRTLASGDTVYRVALRVEGRQRVLTYSSAETAQRAVEIIDRHGPAAGYAILDARSRASATPTLADQLEVHLGRVASHATRGTIDGYRREAARSWLPRLGDLPVDHVSVDHVTGWIAWQREQETHRSSRARARAAREGVPEREWPAQVTWSAKSVANAHGLLSATLASAVEDGHIARNVARGLRVPSDQAARGRVYLLPEEFTRIYAHVPPAHQPLVATLYGTGLRWGEATALTVGDIELDGEAGQIHVRQAWKKGGKGGVYLGSPKSRRALRSVAISGELVRLLAEHLAGRPASALAFTAARGGRVRAQHFHPRVWRPAVAASGIDKQPDIHSLRHSHASNLIRAGISLPVIQRRLGHDSIKTTVDIYGWLAPDAAAGAAQAAALSLAGALPQIEG